MQKKVINKRILLIKALLVFLIISLAIPLFFLNIKINELQTELGKAEKVIHEKSIESYRLRFELFYLEQDLLKAEHKAKEDKFEEEKNEFRGGINYVEPTESFLFIGKRLNLLALPHDEAYILGTIGENAVVDVIDLATVKGEYWYYVEVPINAEPTDYKGWVKQEDTVPYTEKLESKVQSPVILKEGTPVYEVFEYEGISKETYVVLPYDISGRLSERRNSFARISAVGGLTVWVEEKYIVYPVAVN